MKNLKGILVGVLLFVIVVAVIVNWQVNEQVVDPTTVEAVTTLRVDELMAQTEDDVAALNGEIIEVTGIVLDNKTDESSSTITLGMNEMEVIVCQMDNRHLETASKLTKGHFVKFRGKLTGQDFDELMGKTIQMKNCVLITK